MPATQSVRGQTRPRRHLLHLLPPTETRLPFCGGDRQRQETGAVALPGAMIRFQMKEAGAWLRTPPMPYKFRRRSGSLSARLSGGSQGDRSQPDCSPSDPAQAEKAPSPIRFTSACPSASWGHERGKSGNRPAGGFAFVPHAGGFPSLWFRRARWQRNWALLVLEGLLVMFVWGFLCFVSKNYSLGNTPLVLLQEERRRGRPWPFQSSGKVCESMDSGARLLWFKSWLHPSQALWCWVVCLTPLCPGLLMGKMGHNSPYLMTLTSGSTELFGKRLPGCLVLGEWCWRFVITYHLGGEEWRKFIGQGLSIKPWFYQLAFIYSIPFHKQTNQYCFLLYFFC